jgi:hypothetical protein
MSEIFEHGYWDKISTGDISVTGVAIGRGESIS